MSFSFARIVCNLIIQFVSQIFPLTPPPPNFVARVVASYSMYVSHFRIFPIVTCIQYVIKILILCIYITHFVKYPSILSSHL